MSVQSNVSVQPAVCALLGGGRVRRLAAPARLPALLQAKAALTGDCLPHSHAPTEPVDPIASGPIAHREFA